MKRLKGTMVIELTDEVTGEVETITEENMVTNAVNNILGQNPMGVFYNAAGEYDDRVEWNGAHDWRYIASAKYTGGKSRQYVPGKRQSPGGVCVQ